MFRTRSPLDSDDVKENVNFELGLSTIPEDNSLESEQEESCGTSTSLLRGDSKSSFRRSVRDGTIGIKEDEQEDPVIPQNLQTSKLSFTDLLVENQLSRIQLKKGKVNRTIDKKKNTKGLDLTRVQKLVTNVRGYERIEIPEETIHDLRVSETQNKNEMVETQQNRETTEKQIEEYEVEINGKENKEITNKYKMSEEDLDFDIEIELSEIVNEVEEELELMNNKIETISNLIINNGESLSNLKMEELEIERELGSYFILFETSKNVKNLVENKESNLLKTLKIIKKNRIEECEYLLRIRRWLLSDLVRMVKGPSVDYRCGKLEDVDEWGKDMSLRIEKTFNKRTKELEKIKNEFEEKSLKEAIKFKREELVEYLVKEVRDIFRIKMEEDYKIEELKIMYEYELNKEENEINFMGDVTEEFRNVLTPVKLFKEFKEENKEDYKLMKIEENLTKVFVFYAKLAMITWNTLENGTPEKSEWFKEFIEFEPKLLKILVEEVFYEMVFDYIEYFDIESEKECTNLAKFIKFVIQNMSKNDQSIKIEKIIKELENSLKTKVEMMSIKMNKDNETIISTKTTITINDPVVINIIKFSYLNLMSTIMCFSDILSGLTLSSIVIEDLFLKNLVPLLDYQSIIDAYITLNFKVIIMPLKREMQIKSKSNELVKLILEKYKKSEWIKVSNLEIFDHLKIPINNEKYKEIISL